MRGVAYMCNLAEVGWKYTNTDKFNFKDGMVFTLMLDDLLHHSLNHRYLLEGTKVRQFLLFL